MDHREEALRVEASTVVSKELLEEMVWFFRVEDASPWNYSMFALAAVVVVISMVLLGRNIQAKRNRKMQLQEKETPEVHSLDDVGIKENNSLKETLISEKPNVDQVGTELKEKRVSLVLFPNPSKTES
ncbi:organic solute transporter subunit beta [Castor canadensis]|jgi:organic solute transporter subunit beta|uniref:Organic solute transporter subunit beta n=1 Tax=Castor canadensis TaxID=51338 RepID=A0A250YMK8_CASCN|nr:organic solute transporter subunit beta [Castor canadensis]